MNAKKADNARLPKTTNQREAPGTKVLNPEHFKTFEYSGFLFRATMENGEPLFVANDICKALEYSNPRDALQKHCKHVAKRDISSPSGSKATNFIREPDLYRLVFRSKKPEAEAFADFVYEVVLPSIRKTGQYTAQNFSLPAAEPDNTCTALQQLIQSRSVKTVQLTLDDCTTVTFDMSRIKPAQKPRLSAPAAKLQQYLIRHEPGEYSFKTLREALSMSMSQLSNAIYGRNGRHTRGLMHTEEYGGIIEVLNRNTGNTLVWRTDVLEAHA